jgi:hypothetical protein
LSQSKKPRHKYRPGRVSIPVTGLRHEFGLVLHMAIDTARIGHFNHTQYERIGQAINVVWGALFIRPPKDRSAVVVIEGAMRAMNEAGRRGSASGVWTLRDLEQASVLAGIYKIEELLPTMDVMTLYESMQKLKAMERNDVRSAAYQQLLQDRNDAHTTI